MIEILENLPVNDPAKPSLKALLKIRVNKQMIYENVSLLQKDKAKWIGFPSKKEGDKWTPYVYYEEPTIQKAFCAGILKALNEKTP